MNLKLTFGMYLLVGVSISVIKVGALKCYVCGNEKDKEGDDGDKKGVQNPPCDDFKMHKDNFAVECSSSDQACAEITEGFSVRRQCYDSRLNDCQSANKVRYCYCYTDLCNDNIKPIAPTDDEDLIEGSGIKTVSTEAELPTFVVKKSSGSTPDLYSLLIFIPFMAAFCNK